MSAAGVMKEITDMDNAERIKLLNMLFDNYFDNRPSKEKIEEEKFISAWGEEDE